MHQTLYTSGSAGNTSQHYPLLDWLRLGLASLVLVSHGLFLTGAREPVYELSGHYTTLGSLAVMGFFFVSGFVITQALDRSKSFGQFAWRRFLRIAPGLVVVRLITELSMPKFVNSPLWSIGYEILAYAVIAALYAVGIGRDRRVLWAIVATMVALHFYRHDLLRIPDPRQMEFTSRMLWTLPFFILGSIAFQSKPEWLMKLFRKGKPLKHDLSYGVYIWHFAAIRLLIGQPVPIFWCATIAATLVCAAASWFLVERPALKLKDAFPLDQRAVSPA